MIAAAAFGLASCDDEPLSPSEDCLCTTEFAQVTIAALDSRGRPVSDIKLDITMTRTGHKIDTSLLYHDPHAGEYAIFNDAFRALIDPTLRDTGDEIRVVGWRDVIAFDRSFMIGVPGRCRCHVKKFSGPDTVFVHSKDGTF
jgi:hypothetical protein